MAPVVNNVLTSSIPCAHKIDTAGEEASLKYTEDNAKAGKRTEVFHKAHSDHNGTPKECDSSEVEAGTDLADKDSRRGLEDNIGGKEY